MKINDIIVKQPTIKNDFIAYTAGANNTFDEAISSYIQQVETIERAIRLISNIVSLCQFKTFKESGKGTIKPVVIKNVDLMFPNEIDTHIDFKRKMTSSLFSQGASIIIAEKNTDKFSTADMNFYAYDPAKFDIESDGSKLITSFVYKSEDGSDIVYRPEDIIYINDSIDPSNLLYSLSRLKALNDVIQIQAGIVAKTKEFTQGGAKDSVIISAKDPIGEKQQKAIKTAFDNFMKSTSSKTMLINTELKVDKMSNSMSGSEMLDFFKAINQVILDQFNLPPALLGDYSAAGANKNEELLFSLRVWFTTMLKPILENIGLQFTRYFRNMLGLKGIIVKLDFSEIDILDDFIDAKVDRAIKLHKEGLASLNEARELAELPRIEAEAADLHFFPAFLLGSAPVSVENFDKEVERMLQGANASQSLPAGNAGGSDNTSVIDDTRGGDAVN